MPRPATPKARIASAKLIEQLARAIETLPPRNVAGSQIWEDLDPSEEALAAHALFGVLLFASKYGDDCDYYGLIDDLFGAEPPPAPRQYRTA